MAMNLTIPEFETRVPDEIYEGAEPADTETVVHHPAEIERPKRSMRGLTAGQIVALRLRALEHDRLGITAIIETADRRELRWFGELEQDRLEILGDREAMRAESPRATTSRRTAGQFASQDLLEVLGRACRHFIARSEGPGDQREYPASRSYPVTFQLRDRRYQAPDGMERRSTEVSFARPVVVVEGADEVF